MSSEVLFKGQAVYLGQRTLIRGNPVLLILSSSAVRPSLDVMNMYTLETITIDLSDIWKPVCGDIQQSVALIENTLILPEVETEHDSTVLSYLIIEFNDISCTHIKNYKRVEVARYADVIPEYSRISVYTSDDNIVIVYRTSLDYEKALILVKRGVDTAFHCIGMWSLCIKSCFLLSGSHLYIFACENGDRQGAFEGARWDSTKVRVMNITQEEPADIQQLDLAGHVLPDGSIRHPHIHITTISRNKNTMTVSDHFNNLWTLDLTELKWSFTCQKPKNLGGSFFSLLRIDEERIFAGVYPFDSNENMCIWRIQLSSAVPPLVNLARKTLHRHRKRSFVNTVISDIDLAMQMLFSEKRN